MRESIFNTEIKRSLIKAGYFVYKIFDMPRFIGSRFQDNKPCDILACGQDGKIIAIESKQIKKWQAFGLRFLRPHQIETLEKIHSLGGWAFVFLNVRIIKPKENRCIAIHWPVLKSKKSFSKKELPLLPFYQGSKKEFAINNFEDLWR